MPTFRGKKYSLDAVLEFTEGIDSNKFCYEFISSPKFKFRSIIAENKSELTVHIKKECRIANISLELYRLRKEMNPRYCSLCYVFTNTYASHHDIPAETLETEIQSYIDNIEAEVSRHNPQPEQYAVAERLLLLLSLFVEDMGRYSKEDKIAEAAKILDRNSYYWQSVKDNAVFTDDPKYSKVVKSEGMAVGGVRK